MRTIQKQSHPAMDPIEHKRRTEVTFRLPKDSILLKMSYTGYEFTVWFEGEVHPKGFEYRHLCMYAPEDVMRSHGIRLLGEVEVTGEPDLPRPFFFYEVTIPIPLPNVA